MLTAGLWVESGRGAGPAPAADVGEPGGAGAVRDRRVGRVRARSRLGRLADGTISSDIGHLEQVRPGSANRCGTIQPADADSYFGKALRTAAKGTRLARAQALTTFFGFLELGHQAEIHAMTGRVVECPIDEMNKPPGP